MRYSSRDDAESSRADLCRLISDSDRAFTGDHIEHLVHIRMRVRRERIAELEQSCHRARGAAKDRFLERIAADEVPLQKRGNR